MIHAYSVVLLLVSLHITNALLRDIISLKATLLKKLKPFLPLAGFYVTMLAPIYGIGFAPFLGKETDFSTLTNRCSSNVVCNEYIFGPQDFIPNARVNGASEVYPVSSDELIKTIDKVVQTRPRITTLKKTDKKLEYVQRSLLFRFPDVITFEVVPTDSENKESMLAVHSYSIYGAGDLGVNSDRVKTIIKDIDEVYFQE